MGTYDGGHGASESRAGDGRHVDRHAGADYSLAPYLRAALAAQDRESHGSGLPTMLKKFLDWRRRRRAAGQTVEMRAKSGSILAVGGAEDKFDRPQILERFVEEAGG